MALKRRILSQVERHAATWHRCDNCDQFITPGDLYENTVGIHKYGSYSLLWVRKEHIHPNCPFPDDNYDENHTFESNVLEFPLAA